MTGNGGGAFRLDLRIYWEDTDAGGIVYHANYLRFMERARTEWLRRLGVEQQRWRETTGMLFVVTDIKLRLMQPAQLDDLISVTVAVAERGRASIWLAQEVLRQGQALCTGQVRVACVEAETLRPRRLPPGIVTGEP
jgi:acyl-CoA thioester hydrolase